MGATRYPTDLNEVRISMRFRSRYAYVIVYRSVYDPNGLVIISSSLIKICITSGIGFFLIETPQARISDVKPAMKVLALHLWSCHKAKHIKNVWRSINSVPSWAGAILPSKRPTRYQCVHARRVCLFNCNWRLRWVRCLPSKLSQFWPKHRRKLWAVPTRSEQATTRKTRRI